MPAPTQTDSAVHSIDGIPEIIALEEKEEARLQKKLASLQDEETAARRTHAEELQKAESKAKKEAHEELERYKKEEFATILEKGEEQREQELKHIDSSYRKNAPAVIASLTERVADGSILP